MNTTATTMHPPAAHPLPTTRRVEGGFVRNVATVWTVVNP